MNPPISPEESRWRRLASVAREAMPVLLDGGAETPTEAVESVDSDLGPGERADAAWLVEEVKERAEERAKKMQFRMIESCNEAVENIDSEGSP